MPISVSLRWRWKPKAPALEHVKTSRAMRCCLDTKWSSPSKVIFWTGCGVAPAPRLTTPCRLSVVGSPLNLGPESGGAQAAVEPLLLLREQWRKRILPVVALPVTAQFVAPVDERLKVKHDVFILGPERD